MRASLAALQRTSGRAGTEDRPTGRSAQGGVRTTIASTGRSCTSQAAPTATNRCRLGEIASSSSRPPRSRRWPSHGAFDARDPGRAARPDRVFLCRTDHLDDRRLLVLLLTRVVEEPVPDLPLLPGVRDWIDCSDEPPATKACGGARRDSSEESRFVGSGRGRTLPRP